MPSRKRSPAVRQPTFFRRSRRVHAVGFGIGAVVILLILGSFAYSLTLRGKILPGVHFGSRDLGGVPYETAEQIITDEIARYTAKPATFRSGSDERTATLDDVGVGFDVEASIAAVRQAGKMAGLIHALIAPVHAIDGDDEVLPRLVVHRGVAEAYFAQLASEVDRPATPPSVKTENGSVRLVPGRSGEVLDQDMAKAEVLAQAGRFDPIAVDLSFVADPALTDPGELKRLEREADERLARPLVLRSDEKTFTVEPAGLAAWLTVVRDGASWELALDEDAVEADLRSRLGELERKPEPMKTYKAAEPVDPIVAGQDGQTIRMSETIEAIGEAWLRDEKNEVEVKTVRIPRPVEFLEVTAPRAEGRVILTDLTRQTVFAFEDGVLQFFALASTGKYPRLTPTGEFRIYNKTRRQKMSGPGYYLPNVQWVMFYQGDYSLHGTYWHNNFGHPMSHGCTNLSNASAERFYGFADKGTPVVIVGETPRH